MKYEIILLEDIYIYMIIIICIKKFVVIILLFIKHRFKILFYIIKFYNVIK